MCGIAGSAYPPGRGSTISPAERLAIIDSISHRGPDRQGQFADDRVWLGHARLSILDLTDGGAQPMATTDSRYVICYNGEVYNFAELARSLGIGGLRSRSDTEVVLRAFAEHGVGSFALLNGMFALAIYDRMAGKLWLVRDRLGIKPLYYRVDDGGLVFASEIKALLAFDGRTAQCDLDALHEWLYYGTTLGERTLYEGVRKLLPGHYLELDLASSRVLVESYWSVSRYAGQEKFDGSPDEAAVRVRDLLEAAVKRQLVSDVPVGVFLSGGVDSSAITAFASRHYEGRLATYSAGFDFDKGINELPTAKMIAELYGTDHHEIHISGVEIADIVEKMVDHHDMPFSDAANIPLYLLSTRLKGTTKVVLQGDGGDELFGGYSRYTTLANYRIARLLARIARLTNKLLPRRGQYYRRQRYFNALAPSDVAEVMALLLTEEDVHASPESIFSTPLQRRVLESDPFIRYRDCQRLVSSEDIVNEMLFVDAMIILPDIFLEKVDRATMAASIEVRVPFLDNDLVDFCLRLSGSQKVPGGKKKWLLKKALDGIVPDSVLYGPKTGFGVPYGFWLSGALRSLFFDQLSAFERRFPGVLDSTTIRRLYEEHASRRRDRSFLLWKLLNLMLWANRGRTALSWAA